MMPAPLVLLALCPSSADATQALQRESWGRNLSVVIDAASESGVDVSLQREGHLLRGGHLPLGSADCAANLRGVVLAMHAWTRAIDLSTGAAAVATPVNVEAPVAPAPEAPRETVAPSPRPVSHRALATAAQAAVPTEPSLPPAPEAPAAASPETPASSSPPVDAAPPASPDEPATAANAVAAPPTAPPPASVISFALGALGGVAAPGPLADVTIRGGLGFGRWGVTAALGFGNESHLNLQVWAMALAGRVRLAVLPASALDIVIGTRLELFSMGPAPTLGFTQGLEWRQQVVERLALVLAAETIVRAGNSALGVPENAASRADVSVRFSVGLEVKIW